ncbi:MAG: PH domain-containing protein, partial [Candidatus Nanohaloarchaea archaeon]
MDLPRTVHPSRLSPHFVKGYVVAVAGMVFLALLVYYGAGYLTFLPFPPAYLYVLVLLPLLAAVRTEMARHHYEYEFRRDRVIVRRGEHTIEQEDVPYEEIVDVSSVSPVYEQMVDVGDLALSITGQQEPVEIIGINDPQRWEDLVLGRTDGSDGGQPEPGADRQDADAVR